MPNPVDPRGEGEALHKTVTEVAKAVSDAFYKVDGALLGLPVGSNLSGPLKAIRDSVFATKSQAEQLVTRATTELQQIPVATPEEEAAPVPASRVAGVPTVDAETIFDLITLGRDGESGNLSTDGKTVTLKGKPIFKLEGGKAYGSWGGDSSPSTAANVNSLSAIVGISKPFVVNDGGVSVLGKPTTDLDGWVELGSVGAKHEVSASRRAALNPLLRR